MSLWTGLRSLILQELSVQVTVEVAHCAEVLLLPAHVHVHRKRSRAQCRTSQPRGFVLLVLLFSRHQLVCLSDFLSRTWTILSIFLRQRALHTLIHTHRELRGDILRWCADLILFHPMRPSRGTFSCGSRSLPHAQSAILSLQLTRCLYVDGDLFFQLSSLMSPVQTRSLIPPGQRTRVIGVAFFLPALLASFNWICPHICEKRTLSAVKLWYFVILES